MKKILFTVYVNVFMQDVENLLLHTILSASMILRPFQSLFFHLLDNHFYSCLLTRRLTQIEEKKFSGKKVTTELVSIWNVSYAKDELIILRVSFDA